MEWTFNAARGGILAVAALALAACAEGPRRAGGGAPRSVSVPAAPVGSGGPAVWRLRAGLNVAALQCRRTPGLQGDYRRMLARHRSLLAATYEAERRRGGRSFDRDQTRLYNRFAMQRSPARMCAAAAGVAHDTSRMDSARLVLAAPSLLSRLERGMR